MQPSSLTLRFGPTYREVEVGDIVWLAKDTPFVMDSGASIQNFPLAYKMYGALNTAKDNAILLCHGLTGDQYAGETHPVTGKPGWWETLIGPGLLFDTNRYCVIATNVLGGCMGSYGPKSMNSATGKVFGLSFPVLTIGDMVRAQVLLLDYLGIEKLFSVIGGSMGGMQALEFMAHHPTRVHSSVVIAASARHSAQNIAFHEIGRQAIMADPEWNEGLYVHEGRYPGKGLAVARMAAHVTYLSQATMQQKFGRGLQERTALSYGFEADFQVESYLRHQGQSFVDRFDANSYLYITRAMDYFDLATQHGGYLGDAFVNSLDVRSCIISFSSDWLFPTAESREIALALNAIGAKVSFAEVITDKGHDAFLLDVPEFHDILSGFLKGLEEERAMKGKCHE